MNRPLFDRGYFRDQPQATALLGFLYNDFIRQTEPSKMKARLDSLESAISERLQELDGTTTECQAEKIAIEACQKVLQVKIEKLGFPPVLDRIA